MPAKKVQIIGGGPGGLSAARLLKLRHPGWEVEVHERIAPEQTFGFGVGFTGRTLDNLKAADPEAHDAPCGTLPTVTAARGCTPCRARWSGRGAALVA